MLQGRSLSASPSSSEKSGQSKSEGPRLRHFSSRSVRVLPLPQRERTARMLVASWRRIRSVAEGDACERHWRRATAPAGVMYDPAMSNLPEDARGERSIHGGAIEVAREPVEALAEDDVKVAGDVRPEGDLSGDTEVRANQQAGILPTVSA